MQHNQQIIKDFKSSSNCIYQVTSEIIQNVNKDIAFIDKAKDNINPYSSSKVIAFMNQLNNQMLHKPKPNLRLQTPNNPENIKPDNFSMVSRIQQRFPTRRGRSKTRMSRQIKSRKFSFSTKQDLFGLVKRTSINKQRFLDGNLVEQKQDDDSCASPQREKIQRLQKQKQIKQVLNAQQKKMNKVKNKILMRKDVKWCQHDGEILKVKADPLGQWIHRGKSLSVQVSKTIENKSNIKNKNRMSQLIIPNRIGDKSLSKKKLRKNRRKRTLTQPTIQPQKYNIQFSNIQDLHSYLQCAPGSCFISQGTVIRNQSQQNQSHPQRYSKSQYQLMRSKSIKTNNSEQTKINKIYTQKNKINPEQYRKSSLLVTQQPLYKPKGKITIHSKSTHQDLITHSQMSTIQQTVNYSQRNKRNKKNSTENIQNKNNNRNESFNLQYIKRHQTIRQKNGQINGDGYAVFPKPKLDLQFRNPLLKNREKLKNKGSIIMQLKKKFQESLRVTEHL